MGRVLGKVALITGGAMGIGKACGLKLASEGARIIISDFVTDSGQATADEIVASGYEAIFISHDVTQESAWQKVMEQIITQFGQLDILVNNAGVAVMKPILETTFDEYRQQNAVNLDGVFLGLKYGIETMLKTKRTQETCASIINLSSVAGLKAAPGLSTYAMTKGGVRLLSKSVAKECAQAGYHIRINSVHPGIIDTPIWDKMGTPGEAGPNRSEILAIAEAAIPGGVIGKPDDIANGILYLASDESRYVTGSELVIDHALSA